MYSYGLPCMDELKQDDQLEHTYSNYVRIRDVAQKTCQRRWTIGKSGERGSRISVLAARHDDVDLLVTKLEFSKLIIKQCSFSFNRDFYTLSWRHADGMNSLDSRHPYQPSLLASSQDSIQCPHRADECKFLLVSQHWHVHA